MRSWSSATSSSRAVFCAASSASSESTCSVRFSAVMLRLRIALAAGTSTRKNAMVIPSATMLHLACVALRWWRISLTASSACAVAGYSSAVSS